jgi:hypothetical protein
VPTPRETNDSQVWKWLVGILTAILVSLLGGWGAYTQSNALRAAQLASALDGRVGVLEQRLTLIMEGVDRRLITLGENQKELLRMLADHERKK